ncbi:hypothetical protein [Metamycoplasma hyosynoviae]|uniref:hypothetical protein n=1 Tax=Metamycoplasma hyosynoviae TaxID=29559 RepID=UPI0023589374|nr:hypothetical protein [Metamycoplasma hyosynoviae]MDC8938083.1 hypothetical protein [Metamycoplasma hyosynoviae]
MTNFLTKFVNNWEWYTTKSWLVIIPIALFCLTVLFCWITGLKRGVWGGLMFSLFAWGGFALSIFIAPLISAKITQRAANLIDFKKYVNENDAKEILAGLINGLIILLLTLAVVLVGEIFYLIFRKKITKPIRKIKAYNETIGENGTKKSTAKLRFGGMMLATAGAVPMAVLMANPAGIVMKNNKLMNVNDLILRKISFNKAVGMQQYVPGLISLSTIGVDYIKHKDDKSNSLIGNMEKYFQQFYEQKNFRIKDVPKVDFDIWDGNITIDAAIAFYFSLKKVDDDSFKDEKYEEEIIDKFFNGDINKILDGFFANDECYKMLDLIIKKITTDIDGKMPEKDKYIKNIQQMLNKNPGIKFSSDTTNIKVFSKKWQRIEIKEKYYDRVKKAILKIAGLDKVEYTEDPTKLQTNAKSLVRFVVERQLNALLVKIK